MSKKAERIIEIRNKEQSYQANFRTLWQETANLVFPREDQITRFETPGASKSDRVYDTTAIRGSQDMTSGLSAAIIPAGQLFFGLVASDKELNEIDVVRRYLSGATRLLHKELFKSNFMLQFNETLRSVIVFGTGNLYSEWETTVGGLNYKDYDIAMYQIRENNHGTVDTVILTFMMTPRQAIQQFGEENVSKNIREANAEEKRKVFEFIQIVRPRTDRNAMMSDNLNMPFESVFVEVKEKEIVEEGGFREFPFAVVRWMKSSFEIYGRGQGTENLADIRMLQQITKDFNECANKWNNPPLEVAERVEGGVDVSPGAINYVIEVGNNFAAIDRDARGSFPITKDFLEFQQEKIHKAFFKDVFVPLADLTGDRRTTVEIRERLKEGLRRLATPVQRLQEELLDPIIIRSFKILEEHGLMSAPPQELEGQDLDIEYVGELGLALRNQAANAFMQFAAFSGQIAEFRPDVLDKIKWDKAMSDVAASMGVKVEHIASDEEVALIRQQRAQQDAATQAAQMAEQTAGAYKDASGAPEAGSPAAQVLEGVA